MSLRSRTALATVISVIVIMAMLFVAYRLIISEAYTDLEEDRAQKESMRTEGVLRAEEHALDVLLADWASWDDMYGFVQDPKPAFINSNLPPQILGQLNLNALVIRGGTGANVIGLGRDGDGRAVPVNGLTDAIPATSPLLKFDTSGHTTGIVATNLGPMIVSSRPVLMSDGSGTARGVVVMARLLDEDYAQRLAEMLSVEVTFHALDSTDLPSGVRTALAQTGTKQVPTAHLSGNRIAAYTTLTGLNGQPVLILETGAVRSIEAQSGETLLALLITVGLTGAVLVIVLVFAIHVTVVGRLRHLLDEMNEITGRGSSEGLRTHVNGRDEIGEVASGVNAMLDRVEAATAERTRLELAVDEQERLAEEAFLRVGEGLIVVDSAGICTASNPAALRILGVEEREVIGRPLNSVLPLLRPADDATRSAGDHLFETGKRSIAVSRSGDEGRSVVVLRDITDVRDVEHLKRDLVATVSMLSEGDGGGLTDTQQHLVELLERNTDRLRVLVDDLLDMGAIEGGRVTLDIVQTDLTDVCRNVLDELRASAERAGITIRTDFNDATVWGDRQRLRQVLENLVQNAVKFTPVGGWIEVSTHLWNRRATVMVRDTGIGIAPQETERIFEKFYRTNDGARFAHGTGLGLSIARSIVALHGGRLTAESDGRSGTTMTVKLSTDVPPAR